MEEYRNYAACPWRRYFARELDIAIYGLLWNAFLVLLCRISPILVENAAGQQLLSAFISIALTFLFEPFLLHFFKTTVGKAIFGLRIEQENGEPLTLRQGYCRVWQVVKNGLGFMIPFYSLYRLYKSHRQCTQEGRLAWDAEFVYTAAEFRWNRGLLFAAVYMGIMSASIGIGFEAQVPPNRGTLTVSQFAENYNYMVDMYAPDSRKLEPDGKWQTERCAVYLTESEYPAFSYEVEQGIVVGVSFLAEAENQRGMVSDYTTQMSLAALAFTGGKKGMEALSTGREAMLTQFAEYEDFDFTQGGVHFLGERTYEGYEMVQSLGARIPSDSSGRTYYKVFFEMKQAGK